MNLHTYLPQDRLRALAREETLPDRTRGTVLFADISGFTKLTESLQQTYGDRRGEEELTKQLGIVYTALINEAERFGGSVISFAGDSMLCWFDVGVGDQGTETRAVSAAFGMQAAMKSFEYIIVGNDSVALTLKVAVASGPARRFVVGDPEIQKMDALAGATVGRTATAEYLADKGEVLLDEASANALGNAVVVTEWREDHENKEKFAVVRTWESECGGQDLSLPSIFRMPPPNKLMSWMPYAVFEREQYGQGTFLTEFRPCTALFIRFTGIDFDSDSAEKELDAFVREVQHLVSRHDGTLLQLTIGDKGSYAFVNFGALITHEDDSRRAVKTALELKNKTELQLQIGITQGLMRVGAYGGETRKVFGALGDDVNLASRLMTTAGADEILLSSHVYKVVRDEFAFEPRPPLPMKGKAEPMPVFAVTGESQKRALRLQEPSYSLPMVGRQQELEIINEKLELTIQGKGQFIGIVSEAGLGKSRLVAEVIRNARRKGFVGFGGACQSDGIHTPYLVWKSIWQAFFDVGPEISGGKLMRWLKGEIEDRAPSLVNAMPLLNVVLDLNIPENDFTENLEPKIRRNTLYSLLTDCLQAQAKEEPTLIVIEDLHWIDALSHDLLEVLAKALANYAVCFVVAYRPPQLERLQTPRLEALHQFTRIELHELTKTEAESVIRAKLVQLYPARDPSLPEGLVDALNKRAQGNPFYLEELLNYMRDRGLDPVRLDEIELPDSLHTLILSRIDQLSEQQKTTLRVASIIGRFFYAKWLTGYFPELGSFPQVKAALDALESLDITSLDSPEPELAYIFRHIITHEVTYESLPFATRARLHEQLARYLENQILLGASQDSPLIDAIAFHYLHSENAEKAIHYLGKAANKAVANYANEEALDYLEQALTLTEETNVFEQVLFQRAEILVAMYQGNAAAEDYAYLLERAKEKGDRKATLAATMGLAASYYNMALDQPDFASQSLRLYEDAYELARELGDKLGMVKALLPTQWFTDYIPAYWKQMEANLREAWTLCQELEDEGLLNICLMAMFNRNIATIEQVEPVITRLEKEQNLPGLKDAYFPLIWINLNEGNYAQAITFCDRSIELANQLGVAPVMYPTFKGRAFTQLGQYNQAWKWLQREIVDEDHIFAKAFQRLGIGYYYYHLGAYEKAREVFEAANTGMKQVGRPWFRLDALSGQVLSQIRAGNLEKARLAQLLDEVASMDLGFREVILGEIALYRGNPEEARKYSQRAQKQELAKETGYQISHYVDGLVLECRVLQQLEQPEALLPVAKEGLQTAEAIGCQPVVWQLTGLKGWALEMLGKQTESAYAYEKGAMILRKLAESIDDDALRESFLSRNEVKEIFMHIANDKRI